MEAVKTKDKSWYVYIHTNKINNKVYIGITSQKPETRWGRDGKKYKENQPVFYNAIQKYGWDNFKHEILFEDLTKEEAEQKEIELIAKHKSNDINFGYNMSTGGESGSKGYKFTDEQKMYLSEIHKGKNNGMYGKHHTKETIQKISISRLKENLSSETIHKMSIAKKGKKRDRKSVEKQIATISNKVICVETGVIYNGTKEAGRLNNIDSSCISKVCRGERKTAGGYHWCYGD